MITGVENGNEANCDEDEVQAVNLHDDNDSLPPFSPSTPPFSPVTNVELMVTIKSMADIIQEIREKHNISIPLTDEDYDACSLNFLYIDVRRNYFLQDAMRECTKNRFDPKKVIKVVVFWSFTCMCSVNQFNNMYR